MKKQLLTAFHHLTAVSADIRGNKRFYTNTMGMRLVKRSVNQDDVSAYHLFYSDKVATPGNDLTFFDWPVPRERRGNNTITRTGLRVRDGESLRYWLERFKELGVAHDEIVERDGRMLLDFEDPEGQRLSIVVDGGAGDDPTPWEESPVPVEHQIRGLGPVTMTVPRLEPTERMLLDVMNLEKLRDYPAPEDAEATVHVYGMAQEGPQSELHVTVRPDLRPASPGSGGVHHVAFRTPDEESHYAWIDRLNTQGVANSGRVDRYYFRSLYFREPNGVLFEIATDGPGFGVDEDMATLGEKTVLPPFLEPQRERIVANLKPLD